MKPVLVSGIQPSGRLHIGNYLGALKNFVDLQNSGKYQCYFFLADLHSLTEYPADAKEESKRIRELATDFLAVGLSPTKSVIYQHSQIPAHSELAWILSTITPVNELELMTQFKEKAGMSKRYAEMRNVLQAVQELIEEQFKPGIPLNTQPIQEELKRGVRLDAEARTARSSANAGLLFYPTLMAADILLYDAKYVPVGNDQDQHLELTRTLARKFNKKFPVPRSLGVGGGKTFLEPQALHTNAPRIMSLKDPAKKMSKSQPETCLFLDDSPAEIAKKIKTATTDSGSEVKRDPHAKPGISNLLDIYRGVTGKTTAEAEREFRGKRYGAFKQAVAGAVIEHLAPYGKKKAELIKKPAALKKTLAAGSKKASAVANRKIALVKKAVGIAS